jgi:hypothetical protein
MEDVVKQARRVALLLAMLGETLAASPARSYYDDGYTLHQLCQANEKLERAKPSDEWVMSAMQDRGMCLGYIMGVMDGMAAAEKLSGDTFLCAPNLRAGQIMLMARRYLDEHPQSLHMPAADLIANAVREAFPCPAHPR